MGEETEAIAAASLTEASRHQTAKRAAQILLRYKAGFVVPSKSQKKLLLVEFARRGFVVYGKAFDIIKLSGEVDLDDAGDIERNINNIVLCEIKSTGRRLPESFKGYFFALTTAELLVAQNLKERYKFVLVNTATRGYVEMTLQELFARARGIYPTWSIMF
jgi:hypothetical protein